MMEILAELDYYFVSGVPCSNFKSLIERIELDTRFLLVPANSEPEAVGLATGAFLAKRKSFIYIQNSGIGSILNPVMSLNKLYHIPILILVSWRGYKGSDAPEHIETGLKTMDILRKLELPIFVPNKTNINTIIKQADERIRKSKMPAVILVKKGVLDE